MARINVIYNKNMLKSTSTGNNFLLRKKLFTVVAAASLEFATFGLLVQNATTELSSRR